MLVTDIIKAGPQRYTHHYMITMTSEETADQTLECPQHLITLADSTPSAKAIVFGDETLGIEINGKVWAAEDPDDEMRPAVRLPHEVWQYCNLVMGRGGDSYGR